MLIAATRARGDEAS